MKAYKEANPLCEVHNYLPKSVVGPMRMAQLQATDIHHICGSGNGAKRSNELTNIIHVCRTSHGWLEESKLAGFVVCCFAKYQKWELDWEVLERIKGKRLPSWLDTDAFAMCQQWPEIERYRRTLTGRFYDGRPTV